MTIVYRIKSKLTGKYVCGFGIKQLKFNDIGIQFESANKAIRTVYKHFKNILSENRPDYLEQMNDLEVVSQKFEILHETSDRHDLYKGINNKYKTIEFLHEKYKELLTSRELDYIIYCIESLFPTFELGDFRYVCFVDEFDYNFDNFEKWIKSKRFSKKSVIGNRSIFMFSDPDIVTMIKLQYTQNDVEILEIPRIEDL
jgi:hypothetical protein